MSDTEESATIPAGRCISVMGLELCLLQDTKVATSQAKLDCALKQQDEFSQAIANNRATDTLVQGALASMALSSAISGVGSKTLPTPVRIETVDSLVSELQKLSDDIAVENPPASALAVLGVGAFLLKLLQQR